MRRLGLIARVVVLTASAGLATPITRSEAEFHARLGAAPAPATVCGPPRAFLPPPDCSFVVDQLAVTRELVMRRRGPNDAGSYPSPTRRLFGIPEPALFWAAGTRLALLGLLRRPPPSPLRPDAAFVAVSHADVSAQ